jgi:hypothetical protein
MLAKSEENREYARNCGELAAETKDLPSKNVSSECRVPGSHLLRSKTG